MYIVPEIYDSEDYMVPLRNEDINICVEECSFFNMLQCCDVNVYDLCKIIMEENNYTMPMSPYEGVDLYINFRNRLLECL